MSTLFPTPTRLALLADVDNGDVWRLGDGQSRIGLAGFRIVTARIDQLHRAGLVRLAWPQAVAAQRWRLTDAGRAVLDQHRRAEL